MWSVLRSYNVVSKSSQSSARKVEKRWRYSSVVGYLLDSNDMSTAESRYQAATGEDTAGWKNISV
jgi:hypothetical protein